MEQSDPGAEETRREPWHEVLRQDRGRTRRQRFCTRQTYMFVVNRRFRDVDHPSGSRPGARSGGGRWARLRDWRGGVLVGALAAPPRGSGGRHVRRRCHAALLPHAARARRSAVRRVQEGETLTPQDRAVLERVYGMDQPLVRAVRHLPQGRWPRRPRLVHRAMAAPSPRCSRRGCRPPSCSAAAVLLLNFTVGLWLGVRQAVRRGAVEDRGLTAALTRRLCHALLLARPGARLAVRDRVAASSLGRPQDPLLEPDAGVLTRAADMLRHLVLPAVTLSVVTIAATMRYQRAAMLEVLRLPYIVTARAKGLSGARVTWRHAWRNALFPVITIFGLWLPILVTGSVFVEEVFAWPGLGSLAAAACDSRDYPLLMGASLLVAGAGGRRQACSPTWPTRCWIPGSATRDSGSGDPIRRAWRDPRGRTGVLLLALVDRDRRLRRPPGFSPTRPTQPDSWPAAFHLALAPPIRHRRSSAGTCSRGWSPAPASRCRCGVLAVAAVDHPRRGRRARGRVLGRRGGRGADAAWWTPRSRFRGSSCCCCCSPVTERAPLAVLILLIGATGWFATAVWCAARCSDSGRRATSAPPRRSGPSRRRIIFRHLLPNTLGPLLVAATLGRGRRDSARGRSLVSRTGRPAADSFLGRHDPGRKALPGHRSMGRPVSRTRHRHHRAVRQPAGRRPARRRRPPRRMTRVLEVEELRISFPDGQA